MQASVMPVGYVAGRGLVYHCSMRHFKPVWSHLGVYFGHKARVMWHYMIKHEY